MAQKRCRFARYPFAAFATFHSGRETLHFRRFHDMLCSNVSIRLHRRNMKQSPAGRVFRFTRPPKRGASNITILTTSPDAVLQSDVFLLQAPPPREAVVCAAGPFVLAIFQNVK